VVQLIFHNFMTDESGVFFFFLNDVFDTTFTKTHFSDISDIFLQYLFSHLAAQIKDKSQDKCRKIRKR
jgi:hypothetical protein